MTEPWSLERAVLGLGTDIYKEGCNCRRCRHVFEFGREVERHTEARVRAERATVDGFQALVACELARARAKHPSMKSDPHAWAVIQEELDEFRDAYRSRHGGPTSHILIELVHTAAMCQRAAEDLRLLQSMGAAAQKEAR